MDVQYLPLEALHAPQSDYVAPELINSTFGSDCTDLISSALNSRILSFSDQFFADASNLTNPKPPIHRPGVFVPSGAWYDGWETRRHNPRPFDWVIIRLGVASGVVRGVEIDTAFFNGNQAPEISVQGCFEPDEEADKKVLAGGEGWSGWEDILGKRKCGASCKQAWKVSGQKKVTHVRLCMWPDGGIARFRLYGQAIPVWPKDAQEEVELSAAVMGGVAVSCSDQHFGGRGNLLLPGRGVDMGDGWETKRSREKGHVDWVIVRLGARGKLTRVVIDTLHFRGNFPQGVKVEGADAGGDTLTEEDPRWLELLGVQKTGPDEELEFGADSLQKIGDGKAYTHVKMTIIPDGGLKRLRVFGHRA
ncbi:MAG: Allantoicase [Icmadophila ericetorum]|nr:Allantoicase [Icmadophila ericetorum]